MCRIRPRRLVYRLSSDVRLIGSDQLKVFATVRRFQSAPNIASKNQGPLSDVKILDLSRVLAGPFCTQILADYGADVVKVEHPKGGVSKI